MRVLVTGASGLLGSRVSLRLLREGLDVTGVFWTHDRRFAFPVRRVDLRDADSVSSLLKSIRPDIVIHAAALSRVIDCERSADEANRANVVATQILATNAEDLGAYFMYISTDQVFNGLSGCYSEGDLPAPTHEYGRSKTRAESIVRKVCRSYLILRSNNIVGRSMGFGQSFTDSIMDSLDRGKAVELFDDQYRSPIHIETISELIFRCLRDRCEGILHAGGSERLSRYETGIAFAQAVKVDPRRLIPVSLRTHPQAYLLHHDSSFNTCKLQSLYPDLGSETIRDCFVRESSMTLGRLA